MPWSSNSLFAGPGVALLQRHFLMAHSADLKVIIISESLVETTVLMTLLSPLTRNLTACSTFPRGLSILQEAVGAGSPFDLVFLSLPPSGHRFIDDAVEVLALALKNCGPSHTVMLGEEKLPQEFCRQSENTGSLLCKPITREKVEGVLEPLGLHLPRSNCWQYMGCGRGPGGVNVAKQGICPAADDAGADGLHGGDGGGRACWAISGTLCGGKVQGSFAAKITNCLECDFYRLVQLEEKDRFESIDSIMRRLRRRRGMR